MAEESISEDEVDVLYRQMIDSFIDRANELAEQNSPENVGMALLFAASRFNAFVVSQHAENLEDYEKDVAKARQFFVSQYKEMLTENLDDYKKVYQKYHNFIRPQ
jgi:succinate dehydrogenase/fumarate reductase flavoprotein subunit